MYGSYYIYVYLLKMLFFVRFNFIKKIYEIIYCERKVNRISILFINLKIYLVLKLFKVKGWDGMGRGWGMKEFIVNWSVIFKGENVRFIVNIGICIDM